MPNIYLFDWGDTLMTDFPNAEGKMCDWDVVEATDGAKEVLGYLSKKHPIYIATNADDSTEQDIKNAFERVNLAQYISGYFCKENLGISKGSAEFYLKISEQLQCAANDITMVGDTIEKDIFPAMQAGLNVIWFNPDGLSLIQLVEPVPQITKLKELYC
ncbi:HAD family hydrolase [Vibrio rumoiensis]|uniref:Hydrolase n=1 Tax=Vibrio rumoiensis 1S-45 TaxID=1188252 RepID=A0A1E5E2N4_9VIBR|nr:HAD hydrolase-like protein [Vibrio rumoiensis]OEF25790.1 hydrolase [Vibrio rumoiensis 1S-45]